MDVKGWMRDQLATGAFATTGTVTVRDLATAARTAFALTGDHDAQCRRWAEAVLAADLPPRRCRDCGTPLPDRSRARCVDCYVILLDRASPDHDPQRDPLTQAYRRLLRCGREQRIKEQQERQAGNNWTPR